MALFAALTGDAHPLHYDPELSRSTRFGQPVAHGLHLAALTALCAETALEEPAWAILMLDPARLSGA